MLERKKGKRSIGRGEILEGKGAKRLERNKRV